MIKKIKHTSWFILVLLALAQFMVVLDSSIVNVMLPTVQKAFTISESNLQWIITAYTLTFGGFLLLGGRAADLFGRRKVFIIGVTVFTIASFIDGIAFSSNMLIIIRAIQGLAGAFMSPAALSIVLVTYKEGHDRNLALSVWGAVAAGGAAIGVLLGGIITQYLGWRWNFFINVPIGIFVVISALKVLPKHESEEINSNLDLPGALSVTASLILLVYGLVEAPTSGWTSHSSLLYFGLSALLMLYFVINEFRTKHPLMPMSIFKIRNVSGANIIQLMMAASLFSIFFFVTLYVQDILGYSPVKTGVSFLVIPLIIIITAANAPRLIRKIGYKPILIITPLFTATGLYLLSSMHVGGSYINNILPGLVVMGLGLGFTFVTILVTATTGIAPHLSGLASGLVNTAQQLGGSIGLAVLTGIAASDTNHYLRTIHHLTRLSPLEGEVHGFQLALRVAVGFAIASSIIAIFVIKQRKVSAEDIKSAMQTSAG
jgi:EmrB/QacA subfamily drug resistance transporter